MDVIRVENLTKRYGRILAVDNLNLTVKEGECMGLLGPNGAGKTTTIKILTGLLKPTSGRAYIMDIDVTKDPIKALENVGAMIETPELYPELTPRQLLTFIGRLRGFRGSKLGEIIVNALKKVNMSDWADVPMGKFSRGMKQRIALAQAFFTDPDIVILDEPSLGLDPKGMVEIRELIKELNKEGKTILMASHLLYEVQQVCTSATLINKGRVVKQVQISALEEVVSSVPYEVKVLSVPTDSVLDEIKGLKNVVSVKLVDNETLLVTIKGTKRDVESVLRKLLVDFGLRVYEFKASTNMLESLYMDIIKEVS